VVLFCVIVCALNLNKTNGEQMKKKKILLRGDAITQGSSVYFTGRPCKQGHIVQRYTTSGGCIECIRLAREAERAAIKAGRELAGAE